MYMSLLRLPEAVVDPFRDLASSCGVPDAVAEVLQQAGWNVTLFSCWVASAAEVSTEVAKLGLPADLEDTPLLIASLRSLWKACLAASETKGPLPTGATTPASVSSSWADNFPPRMPADELQQLKLAFSSKYPSEILDSDSMPGPCMLALLKKNSSVDWRFAPWKYRLSCKMHDERELATRPKKVARMEFQDLLLDEVPTHEFGHTMGMFMLQSILHLHSVGVALLGLAHLVTLKKSMIVLSFRRPQRSTLLVPVSGPLTQLSLSGRTSSSGARLLLCLRKAGLSMIPSTKWFMSVLPFSLTYSLDQLLLLCLLLPFVREVMARQTGVRARAPLVAVAEVRGGAKGVDLLLQVKAQVPIVLLAKSGWLASVNVLCACFGIKASVTWRIASMSTCAVWLPMASPAWVITGLMSTRS